MARLRLIVLLLLAVLLPVRGALAAAMPCMGPAAGSHAARSLAPLEPLPPCHEAMAAADEPGGSFDEPVDDAGAPSAHGADHGGPHDGTPAGGCGCPLCASGCHAAPLALGLPTLPSLQPMATAFPPLRVWVAPFESDGPERPPRAG